MGTYRTGVSNTRPTDKLKRALKFGQTQLATYKHAPIILVENRTFYLTKGKEIISVKEWIAYGRPDYVVMGTKKGCEGTLKRLTAQI